MSKRIKPLAIGKIAELKIQAEMLAEGFEVYTPLVDDHGVDAIVRWNKGPFLRVQIKAVGQNARWPATFNTGGLSDGKGFFVFRSEQWKKEWIMSCEEVRQHERKPGNITFSVQRDGEQVENHNFAKFKAKKFSRLKKVEKEL